MAGLVLALVVPAIFVQSRVPASKTQPTEAFPKGRSFATTTGQQERVMLPDGSQIILAPQSRLDVVQNFGTATRTVILHGEAYFQVARGRAPFVVQTGHVTTRVLGTAFDIRHYPTDTTVHIAVVTGKVVMANGHDVATLTARMVAHATDSTMTTAIADDPAQFTQWTTGRLIFHNARASDVLAAVSRWYGVHFRYNDSTIVEQVLTAALDARRSQDETLSVLESILDVRMTAIGDTITLTPRRQGTSPVPIRHRATESFPPSTEFGR